MIPNMNWEDATIEPIDFNKLIESINEESIKKECEILSDILIKKNHDYGNSVQQQFEEYGLISILIRIDDKIRRLKNLMDKPHKVIGESMLDTLRDLAGYSILGSICLQILMGKRKEQSLDFTETTVHGIRRLNDKGCERDGDFVQLSESTPRDEA